MPPPRLSRHLRPCHLPVTAKQVRCVQRTSRAKLSTTGYDTTPQTPRTNGSNGENNTLSDATDSKKEVPAENKSWLKKALGHIASFGKHDDQFDFSESKSGRSPHAEQPERPASNVQETKKESEKEARGSIQSAADPTTSQQGEESQQEQMKFADWRKDGFASSEQANMAAMQQQIHRLSEQIKALEARLEGGSPTGQSSSTSAEVLHTGATRHGATQLNADNQDQAHLTQTPSRILLSTKPMSANVQRLHFRATTCYTRSVSMYGEIVAALRWFPDRVVAITAPSILRCLCSARHIALMDDDVGTTDIVRKFRRATFRFESILHKSSIPIPRLNDPLVADEVAKYSKTLLYDSLISHTLDGCLKRYRVSTWRLINVATELGGFQSPMVAPIASRAHQQLLSIGTHASETGDKVLIDLIESYLNPKSAPTQTKPSASIASPIETHEKNTQNDTAENDDNGKRLMHRIHAQSRSMKSSTDLRANTKDRGSETSVNEQRPEIKDSMPSNPKASTAARTTKSPKPPPRTDEVSEQSLLEELFPETNSIPQPQPTKAARDRYPRLKLPRSPVRPVFSERPRTAAQQAGESIQQHGEQIAVLQLTNCSTGLTEADFRRIMPKGKHLEGWRRDSDFYKVIPGRDPLSLERLPFYYLLFKSTEAALLYQKNASRLHKLSARYQPSSILSAIPPPKGFLEDGEDIAAAVASYNLLPKDHSMSLNVLMQPYNPALRQLVERGGYHPIATSAKDKEKRMCRVLLHIEGYEPSPSDLFAAITRDAYKQGMLHPLRNESQSSIHRLRDMVNLKMSTKAVSSSRPRSYGTFDHSGSPELTYDDPEIQSIMGGAEEDRSQAQMNQEVMNRVYNRWVLDFEDADTARRWSLRWHRRELPEVSRGESTWKDTEEARICNTEVLW